MFEAIFLPDGVALVSRGRRWFAIDAGNRRIAGSGKLYQRWREHCRQLASRVS